MLTRRSFSVFAPCAICAVAGLVATDASAQGTPPAATPGVTRKILSQMDGPVPGYTTILMETTIEPGVALVRHTHPGIESTFVLEGSHELPIEGRPTLMLKQGDSFQVPAGTPHSGGKPSDVKLRLATTYVVEKGKPLSSPA
jgi:quercetin dioxygenase-like cupin family protein